jgi:hypothetical protein
MLHRHVPRLCRSCQAPMARQDETCWRCGIEWVSQDGPRTRLRVIRGGASAAVAADERAVAQARVDMERWATEGGSVPAEAAAVLGAAIKRS